MKTKILLLALILGLSTTSFAQNYVTGIGFRGGLYNGLTIKHFISRTTAFEGLISTRWKGVELTGLYEFHQQFPSIPGMASYIGFGGHVGIWNGDNTNWGTAGTQYTNLGVDGIIGLEYSFYEIPINLSIDWKPALNLTGYTGFWYDGGAFSIRYIF